MNWLKQKLKNKTGSEMVEFIVGLAAKMAILMTCLFVLCYMYNLLKIYVVCDKTVRSIEISGVVDSSTYTLVDTLAGDKLDVNTDVAATYFDGATKIQLRDTFTVTLTSSYKIPVFTPMSGHTVYLTFPLKAQVTGMSEHFWRG